VRAEAEQTTEIQVGDGPREERSTHRADERAPRVALAEPVERGRDPGGSAEHPPGRCPASLHERPALHRAPRRFALQARYSAGRCMRLELVFDALDAVDAAHAAKQVRNLVGQYQPLQRDDAVA